MTTFHAVNTAMAMPGPSSFASTARELTPTTPRADRSFGNHGDDRNERAAHSQVDETSLKTPTRDSFAGLAGQLPLPSPSSFPPPARERSGSISVASNSNNENNTSNATLRPSMRSSPRRDNSHQSSLSIGSAQDMDIDMDVDTPGDEEGGNVGMGQDLGSDNESENGDSRRPSKKKKGQRFFCTDFPPCQLSFTRSEHLARHIRKHTGERPFQCHCSRRFSRLDNLRQHAQTVHVNEDIPGDSLAATGTRFQRQIRTDRIRPTSSRSRTSNIGGSGHGHSHSRNLSSSSIDSTASAFGAAEYSRQRRQGRIPPPLAIASDSPARQRMSVESFVSSHNASPAGHHTGYATSPTRFGTPTSATFSTETGSPRFPQTMHSPMSSANHATTWQSDVSGRRLSVPSAVNPFQPPPGTHGYPPPFVSPLPSSTASAVSTTNTSAVASPTSSIFSDGRRDPMTAAEAEWRRRTWHPDTYSGQRPATSGLSYYQPIGSSRPIFAQRSSQMQVTRLPGIESFDQVPPQPSSSTTSHRPASPIRPEAFQHSQMALRTLDAGRGGLGQAASQTTSSEHPNLSSWEMPSLHRGLNRLDITNSNPATTLNEMPARHHYSHSYTPGMIMTSRQSIGLTSSRYHQQNSSSNTPPSHYRQLSHHSHISEASQSSSHTSVPSDPPVTPRKNKRLGWYNGPLPMSSPGSAGGENGKGGARSSIENTTFAPPPNGTSEMHSHQPSGQYFHPYNKSHLQHQNISPEDSTSSSDGVPTPSSHSVMESEPTTINGNGSVEGPQHHQGGTGAPTIQREDPTKVGLSLRPVPNGPEYGSALRPTSYGGGQGQGPGHFSGHLRQASVTTVSERGSENSNNMNVAASVPSFGLGMGPGPVEYSSSAGPSTSATSVSATSQGDDTTRLEALVAVATREDNHR